MSPGHDRARPPAKGAGPESIATHSLDDPAAVCEAYAVVVTTEEPTGELRFTRRPYLSLHSGQKAIRRAQSRGRRASLVLCKIIPVQGDLASARWSE